jgi:hypothetical protein
MINGLGTETKANGSSRTPIPPLSIHSSNGTSCQTDLFQRPQRQVLGYVYPNTMSDSSSPILPAQVGSEGQALAHCWLAQPNRILPPAHTFPGSRTQCLQLRTDTGQVGKR